MKITRGRPKKNPEDLIKYKYIAIKHNDYLKLKTKCTDMNITMVDYFTKTLA